jgi:hypothetical protein
MVDAVETRTSFLSVSRLPGLTEWQGARHAT